MGRVSRDLLLKVVWLFFFSKQQKIANKLLIHVYFFEFKVNFSKTFSNHSLVYLAEV